MTAYKLDAIDRAWEFIDYPDAAGVLAGTPSFQRIAYVTMDNFNSYTDGDATAIASLEEWTDGTSVVVNLYFDSWQATNMPEYYAEFFFGGCIEESNLCWCFRDVDIGFSYMQLLYWVNELTLSADVPDVYLNIEVDTDGDYADDDWNPVY